MILEAADTIPGDHSLEALPRTLRQFDDGRDAIAVFRATALLRRL